MRRNNCVLILCLSLLLVFTACSQDGNKAAKEAAGTSSNASGNPDSSAGKDPPKDVVRAEAGNVEIKAGATAEAAVKLTIAKGYHINGNPPSFPYLKPTELEVEPGGGITAGSAPVYPPAVSRNFAFSKDGPLAVYEGEVVIKVSLNAAGSAKKGLQTLKAKVRVQPCDEEACYLPRTIETTIPVTVK